MGIKTPFKKELMDAVLTTWRYLKDGSGGGALICFVWISKCWQPCPIIAFSQVIIEDNLIVKGQTICLHRSTA